MAKTIKASRLHEIIYELAHELSELIIREHQILQDEMSQIRVLVRDAVNNLDSNFRGLNAHTSEQAEVLGDVFKSGHVSEEQQGKLTEVMNKISSHTSKTIRSLQFDDIVQQLAGHTCNRIARMQELFVELEEKLAIIKRLEPYNEVAILERVQMMREEVAEFRTRLEKENPVRQKSMDAGKIELF